MRSDLPEPLSSIQFDRIDPLVRALRAAVRRHGVNRATAALVAAMVGSSVLLSSGLHLLIGLPVNAYSIALAAGIPLALAWPLGWLNFTLAWLLDCSEQAYRYLASHDALTELKSRSEFHVLAQSLLTPERATNLTPDASCWAMMIDIDHFKSVNDEFGHQTGDLALGHVARTVRDALRPQDVVGRYGGDEIVALLVDLQAAAAAALAQRLRVRVQNAPLVLPGGVMRPLTISIGLARVGRGEIEVDAALGRADQALRAAKHCGRNQLRIASPDDVGIVVSEAATEDASQPYRSASAS